MTTKNTTKETTAKKTAAKDTKNTTPAPAEKVAVPKVEIIRGRMPLPIVAMIKFGTEGETDGAVAAKFRTTNGKVSDVRKDRNFGYVTDKYVPNADMIAKAVEYAKQLDDKSVLKAVQALKPGSEKDDSNLAEARAANRPTKKDAPVKAAKKVEDLAKKVGDDELAALTD